MVSRLARMDMEMGDSSMSVNMVVMIRRPTRQLAGHVQAVVSGCSEDVFILSCQLIDSLLGSGHC